MSKQYRSVTNARSAPSPVGHVDYRLLPQVREDYVISPRLSIEEVEDEKTNTPSTRKDYQPKKGDVTKKAKRRMRGKNVVAGLIALLFSLIIIGQYLLGFFGRQGARLPLNVVPDGNLNAIFNLVEAFKQSASLGWTGAEVNAVWLACVPSIILTFGVLFVLINAIKSVFAIFFMKKPIKYIGGAFIYMLCALAILVAALVGAPKIGIAKIDFLDDFIFAYRTSDLFFLVAVAVGNFIASLVCAIIARDKKGYLC